MTATTMMRRLNANALHGSENGREVFIEDHKDPDGRWFRLEYQCNLQGGNAVAWCRNNPWGRNPYTYQTSHVGPDGFICVGRYIDRMQSPYDLDFVVKRARLWCTLYSYFREHGYDATCRVAPEWRWDGS